MPENTSFTLLMESFAALGTIMAVVSGGWGFWSLMAGAAPSEIGEKISLGVAAGFPAGLISGMIVFFDGVGNLAP